MKKKLPPRPTDAELALLAIIWQRGPSTVRQIWENLHQYPQPVYTTVLKLLQIMADKGLVTRDEQKRTHIYRATISKEQTQRQLIDDLLERAFGGSASQLVMQALATKKASAEELAQIEELLNKD